MLSMYLGKGGGKKCASQGEQDRSSIWLSRKDRTSCWVVQKPEQACSKTFRLPGVRRAGALTLAGSDNTDNKPGLESDESGHG